MGWLDWLWKNIFAPGSTLEWIPEPIKEIFAPDTNDTEPTPDQIKQAQRHLIFLLGAAPVVTLIPALYAASLRSKRKLKEKDEKIGIALENASNATATLFQTCLASPVIAAVYAYLVIQKAEQAKYISKGLGDTMQTIIGVSAAGPAIQGITSGVSAFAKKGK